MRDEAAIALHVAQLLSRSTSVFLVLEVALFAVAVVLVAYLVRKRARLGTNGLPGRLQFLAMVGFVLASTGFFARTFGFNHTLIAFAASLGFLASLMDPVTAVGFLIANSLMRPWEMTEDGDLGMMPRMLFAISMLSWAFHAFQHRRLAILWNRPSKIFYALALWFLFCSLRGSDFMVGLTKYQDTAMISAIVFFLVCNATQELEDVRLLKRVLVVAITGLIVHAILVTVTQPGYTPSEFRLEDYGTVGNSNDLAAMAVIGIPLVLIPAFQPGQRRGRLFAILVTSVLLLGMWLSESRGAMLALLIAGGTYGIMRAKDRRRAIGLALAGIPILLGVSTLLSFSRHGDDLEGSKNSRTAFLVAGLNMGVRNPIWGIGLNNFPEQWDNYAIGTTYEGGARAGHNTWMIAFAENGLPGLVLFVWLFVISFKTAVRFYRSFPELVATLAGYGFAMTFLSHTYLIYPYLIFALILATAKIEATLRPLPSR